MATLDWVSRVLAGGPSQEHAYRQAIVNWICSFCGTEADVITRYRLADEAQRAQDVLRWALEKGYITPEEGESNQPLFYIPTERGMSFAAMGYGIRYLDLLGQRSQIYNRTVASVMAMLGNLVETDEEYKEYREDYCLWDQWELRTASRDKRGNYRFAVTVQTDEGRPTRLPAAVFYPVNDTPRQAVLVEVLSEDMQESEIRKILVNRYKRQDVLCVLCYAAEKHHRFVWQTILDIGAQEKIVVYSISPETGAAQLLEVNPDPVPDSAELVADILECVGEFEMGSVAGLAAYLKIGEHHMQMLLAGAVRSGLLRESRAIVDGVSVYSLSQKGLDEVELDRPLADVTMQGARQAKESLRIAAVLKHGYGNDWIVMGRSQMTLPDDEQESEQVPWIEVTIRGARRKFYADLILRQRKAPGKPPIAVMVITKHYTPMVLNAIAEAWAQRTEKGEGQLARQAILYVERDLTPALKRHVKGLDASKQVKVKYLLEAELVVKEDRARARREQKEREDTEKAARREKRQQVKQQRQIKRKRIEARPPEIKNIRQEVVAPPIRGYTPIGDAAKHRISTELKRAGVDIERWLVTWELVVNVAVYYAERRIPHTMMTHEHDGVTRDTFEKRAFQIDEAGVWQSIPEILKRLADEGLEVKRSMDWTLMDPEGFRERNRVSIRRQLGPYTGGRSGWAALEPVRISPEQQ